MGKRRKIPGVFPRKPLPTSPSLTPFRLGPSTSAPSCEGAFYYVAVKGAHAAKIRPG